MEQLNPSSNDPERFVDEAVLSDRRARRAELAEAELRERLSSADQRVAELELIADESSRARAELEQRTVRELEIADAIGEAADAVRTARQLLDVEIQAREAAEAALRAERIAREAAEQTVTAERAARDAATEAMVVARASSAPIRPAQQESSSEPPPAAELLAGLAAAADRLKGQSAAPETPATTPGPRSGGLVGRTARALRKLRSERP